jgi:hypothetical protein
MISKVVNLIHALVVGTTAILKVYPDSVSLKAAYFITLIKNALKDFDQTQQDPEVYEALAWMGLKNTISWNNLLESQRDNYNQLRQNFISNNINCQ